MKTAYRTARILLTLTLLAGCFSTARQNTLTQVSTIDALLAGVYDGQVKSAELLEYGDTGIGTFDRLDGEMILTNGVVFQVKADGKVYRAASGLKTPFAAVVQFKPDKTLPISRTMNLTQFEQEIERQCPNKNAFYAVKVDGLFAYMKTRSVPAQEKPYPPLVEVVRQQSVFEMRNISGTMVGFYCPPYVKGINVPGYHLHFITEDLKAGGHILDFVIQKGDAAVDLCHRFLMLLPEKDTMLEQVDLTRDRGEELRKVEKPN